MLKIRQCLLLFVFLIPFLLNAKSADAVGPYLIDVPQDIIVSCDNIPAAPNVTGGSDCQGYVEVTMGETTNPLSCPENYQIIRVWTATDSCMATISETQVITVEDLEQPILIGVPINETVSCDNIPPAANVTATDNCDVNITITFTEFIVPNGACPFIHDLVREWTAIDNCGNQVVGTQVLSVEDVLPPVLNGVPGDVVVSCDNVPAVPNVYAMDCDTSAIVTFDESVSNGICPGTYTITRTWSSVDMCGNASNHTQLITVEDVMAPIFNAIPPDTTLICGASIPPPATVTASDNCTNAVVTFNETSNGSCPTAHIITREWTATDECGNASTATQHIFIDPNTPPCDLLANANITSSYNGFAVSCVGASDASTQAFGQNGTAPYNYLWSTGDSTNMLNGIPAGFYMVTITDAAGCIAVDSVLANEPPAVLATASSLPASSPTATDGEVSVVGTGGTSPYTYNWSNGAATAVVSGVPAGVYNVTVTDTYGCTGNDVTVVEVDTMVCDSFYANINIIQDIYCVGDSGMLQAIPVGGVGPYSYNWSNGALMQTIGNLYPALYEVTITDNNGCQAMASMSLYEPPMINLTTSSGETSTPTSSDGVAIANATGGFPPFTYNWSNGAMGATIIDLPVGTYMVTATDNNGCTAENTVEVTYTPNCPGISLIILNDTMYNGFPISCAGAGDAYLSLYVSGGVTPYTHLWNTGDSVSYLQNMQEGYYAITVTDAMGCTAEDSIYLQQPPILSAVASSLPASSPTAPDGEVSVNATGGVLPYQYSWNNGAITAVVPGVPAGNYDVLVTDANNCATNVTTIVEADTTACDGFYANVNIVQDILCFGEGGVLDATPIGGVGPYNFIWSTGDVSQTIAGVMAGVYTVTITDLNGCEAVNSMNLYDPPSIYVMTGSMPTSTPTDSNGVASAYATGGFPPFTYYWSNGAMGDTITNLSIGIYIVTVTDNNGCTAEEIVDVMGPDCSNLTASVVIEQDISCSGDADGALEAFATGGVEPYLFNWNHPVGGPMINNLSSGLYEVTVTDSIGCMVIHSFYLTDPTPVHVLVNTNSESTNGAGDGSAIASAIGGTAPYQYYWDGAAGDTLMDLTAGQYIVTATDVNGCMDTTVAIVGSNDPGCMIVLNAMVNSGYNGFPISCSDASDGSAAASVSLGTWPYTFNWDNGSTDSVATNLGMGTYNVTVTDAEGCTTSGEVTLAPPSSLVAIVQTAGETGAGVNDGLAVATASGGAGGYTYLWDDPSGSTSNVVTGLAPDTYMVTITDANGCMFITTCVVDAVDPDTDGDGFVNSVDNCPTMYNPGQEDSDNDGTGDVCTCDPATAPLVNTPGIHQSAYASSSDSVWTNFCTEGGELLLSLALDGTGAVIPETEVRVEVGSETVSYYGDSIGFVVNGLGGVFLNRNWDVQPEVQPTSNVPVRYYFQQSDFDALNNMLAGNNTAIIPSITDMQFFKVTNPSLGIFPPLPTIPQGDLYLISNGTTPSLSNWAHGSHGAVDHYAEYEVSSFSGGGGGGAEGGSPLPVEMIYFKGKLVETSAYLEWGTASEENNLGFEVQHFNNNDNVWETIGFVAGKGTTVETNNYIYRDMDIAVGANYYRLKQLDEDGHFAFSDIVVVEKGDIDTNVTVYPNPALDKISVVDVLLGKVKIYDAYGNVVKNLSIDQPTQTIDISNLKDGMYFMEVDEGNRKRRTSRFYKSSTN